MTETRKAPGRGASDGSPSNEKWESEGRCACAACFANSRKDRGRRPLQGPLLVKTGAGANPPGDKPDGGHAVYRLSGCGEEHFGERSLRDRTLSRGRKGCQRNGGHPEFAAKSCAVFLSPERRSYGADAFILGTELYSPRTDRCHCGSPCQYETSRFFLNEESTTYARSGTELYSP